MAVAIKNLLLGLAAVFLVIGECLPVDAAEFSAKRGINLDQWTTWPDESRWDEADVLLPFPEWRRTIGLAELEALGATGFDFVRMPVDPSPFLSDRTARLRERLFDEVLESARLVEKAGLKVVVDLHLIPAGGNRSIGMSEVMGDPALFERYVDLVERMARTLSEEDPSRLALELMNEPVTECEGAAAEAWAERLKWLHAAARAAAPKLTLVLAGGCWGSAEGLAALDPAEIGDDNVLWTFHSYAPFLVTHQGATWAGDFIRYVTGILYPPHAVPAPEMERILDRIRRRIGDEAPWSRQSGMLAYLDEEVAKIDTAQELQTAMGEPFTMISAWAERHGVEPRNILLGEFGMIRQEYGGDFVMPAASRAAYIRDMIGLAEDHGYGWSIWSYGGAFGVAEEFEGRKAEPDVLEAVRGLR
jgi:hypothetical protein